jgi:sugar phosphate isomerase/epimerase
MNSLDLSVLLTSLPGDFGSAARQAAQLGFDQVDVVAVLERSVEDLEVLAETGVLVSCAALGRGLAEGQVLDAADLATRRAVLEILKRQVTDAARLGATRAYLVPGTDSTPDGVARFAEMCCLLADFAERCMVSVCVEPMPGRALPTAAGTLAWLWRLGHPRLRLLLDVGHCLLSGEDPTAVAGQAGPLLGYVHLDDNDGIGDRHWPLLTGRLTDAGLRGFLTALPRMGYTGAMALELNPANAAPVEALRQSKELVEKILASGGCEPPE